MKRLTSTAAAGIAAAILLSGCFTPKYDKIPLEKGDVPYILADGDYVDVEGNVHQNQHNVWAMQESDVYNYVRSLVPGKRKTGMAEKFEVATKLDIKWLAIAILLAIGTGMLVIILVLRRKLRKANAEVHFAEEVPED